MACFFQPQDMLGKYLEFCGNLAAFTDWLTSIGVNDPAHNIFFGLEAFCVYRPEECSGGGGGGEDTTTAAADTTTEAATTTTAADDCAPETDLVLPAPGPKYGAFISGSIGNKGLGDIDGLNMNRVLKRKLAAVGINSVTEPTVLSKTGIPKLFL